LSAEGAIKTGEDLHQQKHPKPINPKRRNRLMM